MTIRSILLGVLAGLLSTVQPTVFANPFACKIPPPVEVVKKTPKTEIAVEAPLYKGYAIFEGRRFAVVQIGEHQHSLTTGDRIGAVTVLAITPDFLSYRFRQKVFQTPITPLAAAE